jgi:hypothetical protein
MKILVYDDAHQFEKCECGVQFFQFDPAAVLAIQ